MFKVSQNADSQKLNLFWFTSISSEYALGWEGDGCAILPPVELLQLWLIPRAYQHISPIECKKLYAFIVVPVCFSLAKWVFWDAGWENKIFPWRLGWWEDFQQQRHREKSLILKLQHYFLATSFHIITDPTWSLCYWVPCMATMGHAAGVCRVEHVYC